MRKMRTKIIIILLFAVLLPAVPLSFLVYDLVNQSYRIGVNSQVAEALKYGLTFSKQLYNIQRDQLSRALNKFSQEISANPDRGEKAAGQLAVDTTFWRILSLGLADDQGNWRWRHNFATREAPPLDVRILKQFQSPEQRRLIASDRGNNLFVAVEKIRFSGKSAGYLVLQARLKEQYLSRADHILKVHQIYQTLNLNRHSLPHSFLYAFIVFTLILLSLVVGVGIWISARITAPLTLLVKGTAEIGRGNLDFRLPDSRRNDEFGKLMSHFNRMAGELKANQQRLIYLEKMAAWQQMARKLAHEIKNPLTPIQLTLQQLVDQYDNSNPKYRRLLQECSGIINEEIGSLRRLVSEFSEFGRMPELNLQPGNLNQLIGEVSKLYGERIKLSLDESIPNFPFDHDRMRRVLINLIENALQADPRHQPVEICTETQENTVRLTVSDQGIGIAPEQLSRIFEPYFSTKKEGMGLGLAITRLIVEEHGGSITVESRINQGSTFIIELPARRK